MDPTKPFRTALVPRVSMTMPSTGIKTLRVVATRWRCAAAPLGARPSRRFPTLQYKLRTGFMRRGRRGLTALAGPSEGVRDLLDFRF
jgi:hypothetical protein